MFKKFIVRTSIALVAIFALVITAKEMGIFMKPVGAFAHIVITTENGEVPFRQDERHKLYSVYYDRVFGQYRVVADNGDFYQFDGTGHKFVLSDVVGW